MPQETPCRLSGNVLRHQFSVNLELNIRSNDEIRSTTKYK